MADNHCTLTFSETMSGYFALGQTSPRQGLETGEDQDTTLALHADITISDMQRFVDDPKHTGSIDGSIDFSPFGNDIPITGGAFNLFKPTADPDETHMIYEAAFSHDDKDYYLAGKKLVKDDPGFDLWSDTTTLYTTLHEGDSTEGKIIGAGILSLGVKQLMALIATVEVPDAASATEKAETIALFGRFFLGELWDTYAINKFYSKQKFSESDDKTIDYDVIIIGSGFGGSVTACRLAQKGYSVCVLERGHRWQPKDYPREPSDRWWWNGECPEKENGWIDLQFYDDMAVAAGCGVGGGSLIYANVVIDAEPFVFEDGWPAEISYEELKPYYAKAGKMLNVQKIPDTQLTERARLMKEGAEAIGEGHRYKKLDLAVTFDKDYNYELDDPFNEKHSKTHINAQGVEQGTCIHCGNCDIGCHVQAKNTLDLNY
ncbi:MAG: NAD(P)-binding protein, partial [Gammaproteobacteria bacterium]|nr:NAD(P)-binding protein [Gammaproteobacteria bacterium]